MADNSGEGRGLKNNSHKALKKRKSIVKGGKRNFPVLWYKVSICHDENVQGIYPPTHERPLDVFHGNLSMDTTPLDHAQFHVVWHFPQLVAACR